MGTPNRLDVALGTATADLETFTPTELKKVLDEAVRLMRPLVEHLGMNMRLKEMILNSRSDHQLGDIGRLVGWPEQDHLLMEHAVPAGNLVLSSDTTVVQIVVENGQEGNLKRSESTVVRRIFLSKSARPLLWKMEYVTEATGERYRGVEGAFRNRLKSESLTDVTDLPAHKDIPATLVRSAIRLLYRRLESSIELRHKRLESMKNTLGNLGALKKRCAEEG